MAQSDDAVAMIAIILWGLAIVFCWHLVRFLWWCVADKLKIGSEPNEDAWK